MSRGTSNANERGNTRDRAARKRYLLKVYAANFCMHRRVDVLVPPACETYCLEPVPTCRCYRCGELLTEETLTVDRIVPGAKGGRYVRTNIRPSCSDCASETGGRLSGEQRRKR